MSVFNFEYFRAYKLLRTERDLMFIFFLFLPILETSLKAQRPTEQELFENGRLTRSLYENFQKSYGPDQHLVNGIQYFNQHFQSTGHKFLGEDKYQTGKLWIDNRLFENIQLKYDIYNQQVLMLYSQNGSASKQIILNGKKLEGFQLEDRVFRKLNIAGTDTLIYQIYQGDQVTFLYHWQKNFIPVVSENSISHFSTPQKVSYLQIASGLHEYKGNTSFLKLFPEQRKVLKKFIINRKINLRYASEKQIVEFHGYCNQIMEQKPASQ